MSTVSIIIQIVGSDPASQQIAMPWESKVRHVAEVYIQYFRIAMYVERKKHLTPWWSNLVSKFSFWLQKAPFPSSCFQETHLPAVLASYLVLELSAELGKRSPVLCVRLPTSPPRNIREWSQNPSVFFSTPKKDSLGKEIYIQKSAQKTPCNSI